MSATLPLPVLLARATGIGSLIPAMLAKGIRALVQSREYVFFAALIAMLFDPPDVQGIPLDRICFLLLLFVGFLTFLVRRQRVYLTHATWPMLALLLLGVWGALNEPYGAKNWSVMAAKWIVPVAMFHVSALVFDHRDSLHNLEWFSILVLLYLALTAIFQLLGAISLVWPPFILNESVGIHVERARGPFLQAVANGVCLTILGLTAWHSWERRRLRGLIGILLIVLTPVAIFATKTRAVWLASGFSLLLMAFFSHTRRGRWLAVSIMLAVCCGVLCAWILKNGNATAIDRLQDRSPVEFRMEMYRAGWRMFLERPLLGWANHEDIQRVLTQQISGFRPDYYVFHNTYLELAVERGLVGIVLYAWLFVALFRLGARGHEVDDPHSQTFPGQGFAVLWRVSLFVYLVNASAVVMNYQFLNAYVFTIAGILASRQRLSRGGGHEHPISLQQLS